MNERTVPRSIGVVVASALALAFARALPSQQPPSQQPVLQRPQPRGVLPLPDYSGDWMTRQALTGDWNGERQNWAEYGLTADATLTQYGQGIGTGGTDSEWAFGGAFDVVTRADLERMQMLDGALLTLRAESRYGDSVNTKSGLLLPVNMQMSLPITDTPDEDVVIAITELNFSRDLGDGISVLFGKVQNGDLDPNEFASGRGRTQFMDFAFVQNPVVARTVPYSTLAVGGSWQPAKDTTVTTMLANLDDSSTTSGFEDIGDGAVVIAEADFQWPGTLPGGVNVGGTYAFDGDFTKLGDKLQFSPGATPTLRTDEESWSVYGSAWQYMAVRSKVPDRIDPKDGRPDVEGYGWFTRFGMADRDTNPIDWSLSFGIGGRGTVGGRTDDGYGFGWFYSDLQQPRPLLVSLLADHTSGFEAWYDFALARSTSVTVDAQWVDSAFHGINDAFILGFRFSARL